jgi:hypothetical protein
MTTERQTSVSNESVVMASGGDEIDLSGGWDTLWGSLTDATGFGNVMNLVTVIGVAIVVLAFLGWLWKKFSNRPVPGMGSGGGSGLVWAMIVGAVLTAPNLLLPTVLTFVDLLLNAGVSIFQGTTET